MSTVVRHLLGAVFGVVLTLLTWIGFAWAGSRITMEFQTYFSSTRPTALGALVLVLVIGAALGLAASARFASPIAALIPGVVFFVLGLAIDLAPTATKFLTDMTPFNLGSYTFSLSMMGVYPLLGVLLIVSAIPPHRWRSARPVQRRYADYVPGAPAPADGPGWVRGAPYPGGAPVPGGPGAAGGQYGAPPPQDGPSPAGQPPAGSAPTAPYATPPDAERSGGGPAGEERPRPPETPPAG